MLAPSSLFAERFEIERLVRSGGMGAVYRALDQVSGQHVALKLLDVEPAPDRAERFVREAQTLAGLHHPAIVAYVAHGHSAEGQPFLAMQWLEGEDLAHRLRRGRLSLRDSLTLMERVADALAAVHQHGVVHRDLKPSNLFLRDGRPEQVMLIDFGIARSTDDASAITRTGMLVGTPNYMAPEQARGAGDLGPPVDVFALGCVFYECLSGKRAFEAEHVAAALAKILFDEPPRIRALRPGVPEAWAGLLARMLGKAPATRPRDAAALKAELLALPQAEDDGDSSLAEAPVPSIGNASWTGAEQQFVTVVLAHHVAPDAFDLPTLDAVEHEQETARLRTLMRTLRRFGTQAELLFDRSLVVTVAMGSSIKDQAAVAARAALLIREHQPAAHVVVATGPSTLKQRLPVGEAIDRAAQLVARSAAEGIVLDELTAGLLDARFWVEPAPGGAVLKGERASVDEARRLFGKPTAFVGRDGELRQLEHLLQQSIDDVAAKAALVTAPAGMGKSRLWHELRSQLRVKHAKAAVFIGYGDPLSAGSPYGIVSEALRRHAGIRAGEAPALQQKAVRERLCARLRPADLPRVSAFLGELCGVPFADDDSPALRAARGDPRVMSDQIAQAFLDWLRAECAAHPVLFVLEDLHWGDALTVKLVEAALRDLSEQPLFILALARPEVDELFPKLWVSSAQRLTLQPLSKQASARLVESVLSERAPGTDTVECIVKQAAGNALFLEELIRATAEGKGNEVPETVLAMLQARLLRLDPRVRALLRAVSVFGATFWTGALACLAEPHASVSEVAWALAHWVEAELVEKRQESRFPDETEYGFRHALVRDAAYSLLADTDRKLGHRRARAYLEQRGETDAMALAEHAQRGDDLPRAAGLFLRAASQSLDRNDLAEAHARAERGARCGAQGEGLGALRAVQSLASFGLARLDQSIEHGREALELLPRGSAWWCKVVERQFTVLTVRGQARYAERLRELVDVFLHVEPAADARPAYVCTASRLMLVFAIQSRHDDAYAFLTRIERTFAGGFEPDQRVRSWFLSMHGRSLHALEPAPYRALMLGEESERAGMETEVASNLCFPRLLLGLARMDLGDAAGAVAALRGSLAAAEQAHDPYLIVTAQTHLAWTLVDSAEPAQVDEAERVAKAVLDVDVSPAHSGGAHTIIATVRLVRGDAVEAEVEARRACEQQFPFPTYVLWAKGVLLEAQRAQGRVADAAESAREGLRLLATLRSGGISEVRFRVAAAEALDAAGERDAARRELGEAIHQIELRAGNIPDPIWKERYLTQRPENRRAVALARAWNLDAAGSIGQ